MRKRKMQKIKNKTITILITVILMISVAIPLVNFPAANANTPPWNFPSYAYIVPAPEPIGVGQTGAIVMWIDYPLPSAVVGNDIRRHDYTLTITKPNGQIESKHWDVVDDTTSIQSYQYTPDQVGTYILKFDYAGQTYTWSGTYQNDTYAPATRTINWTVQAEQLPPPQGSYPLPKEYWARPIEGQNTYWSSIASNWLGSPQIENRFQPDGIAPNSAHVMWSKSIAQGGVVGGSDLGIEGKTFYMGGSYNVRWSNPLVMNGNLYYELPYGNSGSGGGWVCVDLRTGEQLWYTNTTATGSPSFGYLYALDTPNQHGVLPNGLLFTSNFARAYEPDTGIVTTMNITNVPSGTSVLGPKGEILRYTVTNAGNTTNPNWRILQWNSSKVFGGASGTGVGGWYSGTIPANCPITPVASGTNTNWNGSMWVNSTVRAAQGYTVGVTTPAFDFNNSITLMNSGSWTINRARYGSYMLLTQGAFGGRADNYYGGNWYGANITCVSLKEGSIGQVLWGKYFPALPGNVTRDLVAWDPDAGVFVFEVRETQVHYGYSLTDGNLLWGPSSPANQYDYFRSTTRAAYGNIYFGGFGGILYCMDIKTGELKWTYGNGGPGNSTDSGLQTAWGHYPIFMPVVADGKIFLSTTEHSPDSPYYKDARVRAINATDGTEIWTLMGWGTGMDANYDIVADGFYVYLNCYDMKVYSIGKGPSETSVNIQNNVISQGNSVLIEGSVFDIAAGTKQAEQAARFPAGVPAVSDKSQTGWMEYVYMQKPRPTDTVGVDITLTVIDPNGNVRTIGTTTNDQSGKYSYMWQPDVPGKYTVIASFDGSESYWPSYSEAAFGVMETAPTPTPTADPVQSTADMYFVPAIAGLFVFVAIIGVVLALLMLRKRP
jgi:outer membrane protein assembly factor BamB